MIGLVAIVTGFASGIFSRSLLFESWWPIFFALLLALIFFVASFLTTRRAYTLGAVFCMCLVLGGLRAGLAESPLPSTFLADLKHRVTYEALVVGDPDLRDTNQRVALLVTKGDAKVKMLAVAPRVPEVKVGDTVRVSGTLSVPESFADDNGRVFRYDKYLERDGIRFMLNFAYVRVEKDASRYSIPAALARIKHSFLNGLQASLPEPYASLASGIVIGGKSGLGNELKDAFTRSGLVHIVVLSGHNVMIVASWAIAFFIFIFARAETVFRVRIPRGASIVAGALALILFVGIAGFSATAIRAALMALIALYARATGRTYVAGRALLVVIFLMLLWNPLYLAFDPGFGLSVVATAGLIWLAPIIEVLLARVAQQFRRVRQVQRSETLSEIAARPASFWVNIVAITLAAQVAVLPLLLYFTGNLSLVAFPANIVAALVVPFAMAFSYLAGFGGILFGSSAALLAIILGMPAYGAAAALIELARASATLPFAAFTLPSFPFWLVLLSYAALIYFVASSYRFSTTDQLRFAKKAST